LGIAERHIGWNLLFGFRVGRSAQLGGVVFKRKRLESQDDDSYLAEKKI
jgi:hypothetical protein